MSGQRAILKADDALGYLDIRAKCAPEVIEDLVNLEPEAVFAKSPVADDAKPLES